METCPYCDKPIEDLYEYFGDSSYADFECPHCGQRIAGSVELVYLLNPSRLSQEE